MPCSARSQHPPRLPPRSALSPQGQQSGSACPLSASLHQLRLLPSASSLTNLPVAGAVWLCELERYVRNCVGSKDVHGGNGRSSTGCANEAVYAKVHRYANSRLPPSLPPLKLYLPTYPLLCLAAQYSQRVYEKPSSAMEQHFYVSADHRTGTKAMVIKSLPLDDMKTVVLAIRGTQSFWDWAINIQTAPTSPRGFLDDASNFCHAGFLSVARKMVLSVAARLQRLLMENPSHSSYSLLITGHSAGGAVASLLYLHMLSEQVSSELTRLRGLFKRVHCVTFGAPPISVRPLQKPSASAYQKSIFFAFVNEGDPVPRADKSYVLSLLELYVSTAPAGSDGAHRQAVEAIRWRVPPPTLSLAGRLVLLRVAVEERKTSLAKLKPSHLSKRHKDLSSSAVVPGVTSRPKGAATSLGDDVQAYITANAELRDVVFGDPMMHMMDLYAKRMEILAMKAVTGKH